MSLLRAPVSRGETAKPARPVVAHFVYSYLFGTGSWIYGQLTHMRRFAPIVLTNETENLDIFSVPRIYDYSRLGRSWRALLCLSKGRLHGARPVYFERVLRRERARLIHSHFGPGGVDMLGLKRSTGLPLVTTFYGADASQLPRDSRWQRAYAELFGEGDLFLAEGNAMRQTLMDLGCRPERVVVQHLGVPLDTLPFVPRRPDPSGEVKILVAATFREKKGVPDALEAVARLRRRHTGLRVTLIGDATDRPDELEEKARILHLVKDLDGAVSWLGFQPYPRFKEALLTHHLFLSPSHTAANGDSEGGAPVSLIEAQATGMPVVSTTHADIPEVVVHGRTGLLSPERDLDALAENLERLVTTPSLWEPMGAAGRAHVEEHYNVAIQASLLEDRYEKLLQAGRWPGQRRGLAAPLLSMGRMAS